jgi:glycosyltransferase involved in cell wall biosynthesis
MRIGVNLIPLRSGQMGGHEFYVRRLMRRLLLCDRRNHYFLFTAWWNDDSIDLPHGRLQKIMAVPKQEPGETIPNGLNRWLARYPSLGALPLPHRWASSPSLDLHAWVRRLGLDLWFCPMTNLDPRHLPIPTVVTIADIQQEYYPEFFTRAELQARALMYGPSCQEATAVIAVSDFSKRCLIEKYGLLPEKVHCVYEAGVERVDDPARSPTVEEVRRKHHLPASYAVYPANMWPHKNHHLLLLALHRLRQSYGMTLSLVLTGDDMGQRENFEALVRHFHLQELVRHLGYVAADDLPGLYRGATMLLFPSLFEGFGIPLVEAMALGCPIAAANTASIPEVVGDAALLFDPRQPDSIATVCFQLLTDDELRRTLIARGRARATRFSWERAAAETLRVFEWARAQGVAVRPVSPAPGYRIEGVYRDGWAVRRVRLYLPYLPEMKALKIEGFSDHLDYPVDLRMKVDGRRVQELSITSPGKFTFVGELLRSRRAGSGVQIELIASKHFIPTEIENTLDTRRLAYQIEKLLLICAHGPEIPVYTPPLGLMNQMPVGDAAAARHGAASVG